MPLLLRREGGRERGRKQRCWPFNVLKKTLSLSGRTVHTVLLAVGCWQEKEKEQRKERERVSGPKSAVQDLDFSLTLQSDVCSKLLWTASFRVEGLSLRGWQLHGDKVQLALAGVRREGAADQSGTIVMVLFRGKSLFVPSLFKPTPGSSQSKWDF